MVPPQEHPGTVAEFVGLARSLAGDRSQSGGQRGEPVGQEAVDLGGAFLPDPVAAAVEERGGDLARQRVRVRLDRVGRPCSGGVQTAADEQGGLGDGGAVEGGEVLPVAVHVPVAVERSGQASALKFSGGDVEVLFGEPDGQPADREPVAQSPGPADEMRVGSAGRGV